MFFYTSGIGIGSCLLKSRKSSFGKDFKLGVPYGCHMPGCKMNTTLCRINRTSLGMYTEDCINGLYSKHCAYLQLLSKCKFQNHFLAYLYFVAQHTSRRSFRIIPGVPKKVTDLIRASA